MRDIHSPEEVRESSACDVTGTGAPLRGVSPAVKLGNHRVDEEGAERASSLED